MTARIEPVGDVHSAGPSMLVSARITLSPSVGGPKAVAGVATAAPTVVKVPTSARAVPKISPNAGERRRKRIRICFLAFLLSFVRSQASVQGNPRLHPLSSHPTPYTPTYVPAPQLPSTVLQSLSTHSPVDKDTSARRVRSYAKPISQRATTVSQLHQGNRPHALNVVTAAQGERPASSCPSPLHPLPQTTSARF